MILDKNTRHVSESCCVNYAQMWAPGHAVNFMGEALFSLRVIRIMELEEMDGFEQ